MRDYMYSPDMMVGPVRDVDPLHATVNINGRCTIATSSSCARYSWWSRRSHDSCISRAEQRYW